MTRRCGCCVALFILSCLAPSPSLDAQAPIPVGSEFQINSYTPQFQSFPAVALDADGDFVVVWHSYTAQDGNAEGVFARRFSATGIALAAEFQVNAYTLAGQKYPAVARDAGGGFVIAWQSFGQDSSGSGIFARRYDAAGVAQDAEFQVSSYTENSQGYAAVGLDAAGDFVIAWQSFGQDGYAYGVFARRWSAAGVAQSVEFQVSSYTATYQGFPAVALDTDGDFVVAWRSTGQDGSESGIFAQRFSAAGNPQGAELQVNSHTDGYQDSPAVASDADGDFLVAWNSDGQDGSAKGVFARRFSSAGDAQGSDFLINSHTTNDQEYPSVGVGADGAFAVTWASTDQDGSSYGVFARRLSAAGIPLALESQVNSSTLGTQHHPALGVDAEGDFVVAWHSFDQDGDKFGVFAQRYTVPAILDIDGNGSTEPLTDGLLVLRFLFGFTGATLVTGAFDTVNCIRCDATTIQAYLETLN